MDDRALSALHTQLSSQEATRGAHGGLGFDKADSSSSAKKAKGTQASRVLLDGASEKNGGGPNAREFHTTTAGAVAAGHWDPWSRPVEFKMKEVNRRVGGLYSMFVKGGTVGATLGDAAPAESASSSAAKPASSSAAGPAKAAVGSAAAERFNWKRAIKQQLRAAPEGLRLKRLRKAVLAEWRQASGGGAAAAEEEEERKRFKRKLKKTSGVIVSGRTVKMEK